MKKILSTIFLLGVISIKANSQVLIALIFGDKLNSEKVSFGLNAGLNASSLDNVENAKYAANFNLGFYFDFKFKEHWSFHPGVNVKSSFGAKNIAVYPTGDPDLDDLFEEETVRRKLNYFSLPLTIRYQMDSGFGVEAGPQVALMTKVFDVFETENVVGKDDLTYKNNVTSEYNRLDFGLTGGVSYQFPRGKRLTINAAYYQGLVNVLKHNEGNPILNKGFIFNVSIPVGAKTVE